MRNENNNGTKTIAATNSTEKKKEQITKVDANSDENLPQVNTSGTGTDKTYASATKKRLSPNLSDSAVSNSVQHVMSQTVTLAENKNPEKLTPDSVIKNQVPVEAISIAKNESAQSYINVASPEEDENTSVTASAKTTKQSFFGRLTDAAKKVNALGIKRVNGEDEEDSKSIIIGGLVVSESSN